MMKTTVMIISIMAMLLYFGMSAAQAQEASGSIVGRVYRDTNGDGVCVDTGEAGEPAITVELVNLDDETTRIVNTGGDGFFRLGSVTSGSWEVTVVPGEGWQVTSQQTREIVIDDDEFDIDGVTFCIMPAAENVSGTISGVVFNDVDANAVCRDTGESGAAGIPLQLINLDDNTTINLTSDGGGFYELINANGGTWQVTVNPGSAWRVTSQQTRQVIISTDNPESGQNDFCIVQVSAAATPQPVLPESGAPLSPSLLTAALLGILLLAAGVGLFVRARVD